MVPPVSNPPDSNRPRLPVLPSGVAQPSNRFFDPWNSSSTGHQRAENVLAGSTSWRDSRQLKLHEQYIGGTGGGVRVSDTVGVGSEAFGKDGRKPNGSWERGAPGLRQGGQMSLREIWGVGKAASRQPEQKKLDPRTALRITHDALQNALQLSSPQIPEMQHEAPASAQMQRQEEESPDSSKQIFANLTVYINGSTAPYISDHKLKHLLAEHGARISITPARRTVTHVIIGTPAARGGVGGGLSGSKLQQEIARVGGKGVRFVGAEWVVESIRTGKRLPEGKFEVLKMATKGQGSVINAFSKMGNASG